MALASVTSASLAINTGARWAEVLSSGLTNDGLATRSNASVALIVSIALEAVLILANWAMSSSASLAILGHTSWAFSTLAIDGWAVSTSASVALVSVSINALIAVK